MGPTLATAARAIQEVIKPERIYLMSFAEHNRHVHMSMVPRGDEVPEDHRSATYLRDIINLKKYGNPSNAAQVDDRIRAVLASTNRAN